MLDKLFGADRRTEPRLPQSCDVVLLRDGRPIGRAQLLDLSDGGARLRGAESAIRSAAAFVIPGQGVACVYEAVHSGFAGVGVRILRRQALATGGDRAAVKRFAAG